jgi:ATP-binding cassette subfamily F protein uup
METLELLEEILLSFEGTVLLVSHDREFMDNVVTSLLVLKGNGEVEEQAGGYSDWEARGGRLEESAADVPKQETSPPTAPAAAAKPVERKHKLSYKDQRELDALPERIESLESQQAGLEAKMSDPEFYQQEHAVVQDVLAQAAQIEQELEQALERWTELEG